MAHSCCYGVCSNALTALAISMITRRDEPVRVNGGMWEDEGRKTHSGRGLTKREHFAALAMQGLLANATTQKAIADICDRKNLTTDVYNSMLAVEQADALIAALNQPQNAAKEGV